MHLLKRRRPPSYQDGPRLARDVPAGGSQPSAQAWINRTPIGPSASCPSVVEQLPKSYAKALPSQSAGANRCGPCFGRGDCGFGARGRYTLSMPVTVYRRERQPLRCEHADQIEVKPGGFLSVQSSTRPHENHVLEPSAWTTAVLTDRHGATKRIETNS